MKKNRITLLLTLLMVGVPGFLMEGNPQKQDQKKAPPDCKIAITINTSLEMMDESLRKQLNCFAKVAAIVNKKKQHNPLRPFRDQLKKK